ncbi:MAG: DEAD/DEAH box helicase family protein [Verrucomicrobiota bacterium]
MGEGSLKQKFRQNVAAIELLRAIEAENRPATDAEKAVLVKFTGWGGMPQAFAEPKDAPTWSAEQKHLKHFLLPKEYRRARASTLNAHYTSPTVVRAMYAAVERLGFKQGRILEPACGLGHFFGFMPATMHEKSSLTGIELDELTARLARKIYPGADIRAQHFEEATLATNSFDLAISNVPFGDYQPFDPKFNACKFRIHDYFFIAGLERVRPGGLVLFITTRGTMDKRNELIRTQIAARADLVAAVRLPNTAFKKNANTQVTTDIIILRKRGPGEKPGGPAWLETREVGTGEDQKILLNEYFHARPEMMLGRMELAPRGMYGRDEATLEPDGRELGDALAEAVTRLPAGIYQAVEIPGARQVLPVPVGVKPNAYTVTEDGRVGRREGDELALLPDLPEQTARRIRALVRLREAARECLRTQVEDRPDDEVLYARTRLNEHYDHFVNRFGAINESANVRAFAGDPDLPLLLSLETFNEDTGLAAKTAIFGERTVQRQKAVEAVQTAPEALVVSLNEKGRIDVEHMSRLLGRPAESFLPELQGAIYLNPATRRWEPEDEYLSGNVRAKLAHAEERAKRDSRFHANVEALRAVQPIDLTATEIDARLGSVWIPSDDVAAFVRELLQVSRSEAEAVRVSHAPQLGLWSLHVGYYAKRNVANITEWGTDRIGAAELIEGALNLRTPTVYDLDAKKNPFVNAAATEAAREKQQKIKDRFAEWIWQDDARRERLVRHYNTEFNSVRLRTFNGEHLTLPGASPAITLRPHQKAAIWRILQSPNTLLAHVVGAGKTYTMCAAAMELKRLGLARKPLFVIPNHMLGQFSAEMLALYPNANLLVAGKADFESERRRQLMSRIATSNWDAVIVTHSGFERLPMSTRVQEDFIQGQIAELEEGIREQQEAGTRMVKELERAKKRLEAKLKTLAAASRKDDTLTFEELGVDRLFIDEAQAFKNLFYVTKMTRVAGLPQSASERAFDMFLKVQHVQRLNGGGGVVFATGTPITNTMAEMFTMQRYLQMDVLRRQHLQHFDSWAATFGETVTAMELAPDGSGYRLNTRFARFVNVPELMQQFRQMADIQTAAMLKLPVPALHEGKATVVRAPVTPELKALVAHLAKRAEKLKTSHVDPRDDNMLKITGEGRKAALDLRLLRPRTADHDGSKVNLAVARIFKMWEETRRDRLTQMVFCDLSTPLAEGRGFSVYQDIQAKLVARGVPPGEIAFVQDADADAAKTALFKDVRAGRVRILMGSTQKMGAGTNVQSLLVALHHLDAPWRPADIEQREGRILRQGNRNAVVQVFRYVTEGSFDAYMWQILETKAKFIAQVMTGESTARRIEDLDAPALTYAEVKAIASGNPLVIEKAKVDAEVMRLARLRSQHDEQYSLRRKLRHLDEEVPRVEKQVAGLRADLGARHDTRGDAFRMTLDGRTYTERVAAGTALIYLVNERQHTPVPVILGDLAGFKIEFRSTLPDTLTLHGQMSYPAKVSASPVGIIISLEHAAYTIEDRAVARQSDLEQYRKTQTELAAHIGKSFEHEDRYRKLLARQAELVQALDLTKNQAPGELSGESVEAEESMVPLVETKPSEAETVRVAI